MYVLYTINERVVILCIKACAYNLYDAQTLCVVEMGLKVLKFGPSQVVEVWVPSSFTLSILVNTLFILSFD